MIPVVEDPEQPQKKERDLISFFLEEGEDLSNGKSVFTERLQAIGTEPDEAQRRELIAQLIEDGEKDYDAHAAAVAARDQAPEDNEKLRSANMQLFLRVGEKKDPTKRETDNPTANLKFEDLFNEKGELK